MSAVNNSQNQNQYQNQNQLYQFPPINQPQGNTKNYCQINNNIQQQKMVNSNNNNQNKIKNNSPDYKSQYKAYNRDYNILSGASLAYLNQNNQKQLQSQTVNVHNIQNNNQNHHNYQNNAQFQTYKDDYHMQNHGYYKKYQQQPKQVIIKYDMPAPPKDFNPHFTKAQNEKIDILTGNHQPQELSTNNQNIQQNYYSQNRNTQNPNHTNLYYQYRKNQQIQENYKKIFHSPNPKKADIITNLPDQNQTVKSLMNYRSINYDPINFTEHMVDERRNREKIYNFQDFQSGKNEKNYQFQDQFRKGGSLTKYLDDRKISTIEPNPVYNQRYQQGNIDFKNQKGEFTQVYDNHHQKVFGRHFRKFK
ncbi:hypothetical protein PPERSA_11460 [Pseudocohnilembus persalinus]|uniref:Uncharacterized protein n=1 Tax=Pseudocohnilembus persalinus TaxID=266149 RepID=A0A0V0QWX3_PSEPJ|nr:hypothetical protein PPERSA_11460 [Pseudocohnilembus persalinus]|eukprot:KRX06815.1 hypothetical protein PPERSA_11460 [Pseudocohnilembus persalinus]